MERVFTIGILSNDWNRTQFTTPRFTAAEIGHAATPLRQRAAELESKLKALGQKP